MRRLDEGKGGGGSIDPALLAGGADDATMASTGTSTTAATAPSTDVASAPAVGGGVAEATGPESVLCSFEGREASSMASGAAVGTTAEEGEGLTLLAVASTEGCRARLLPGAASETAEQPPVIRHENNEIRSLFLYKIPFILQA